MEVRILPPAEYPRLYSLWREAFGDNAETVEAVLRAISPADCFVLEENGAVVSMLFSVPQTVCQFPIIYFYAVATAKDFRGRGLAATLLRHAESAAKKAGAQACLLCPAEDTLTAYYAKQGYTPWSKKQGGSAGDGKPLSAEDYLSLREQMLADIPHNTPAPGTLSLYTVTDRGVWDGRRQIDSLTTPHSAAAMYKAFTESFPKQGVFTFPMD